MSPLVTPELPDHAAALENVLDAAFGPGRFAKVSERVRERMAAPLLPLSRVLLQDGALIGGCRISLIGVGGRPVYFLGPLAVAPSAQRHGLGATLVTACVAACEAQGGADHVLLVGAPSFFRPLGFEAVPPYQVIFPGPVDHHRVMSKALGSAASADALAGPVTQPPDATPR